MADPYRVSQAPQSPRPAQQPDTGGGPLRSVLWLALIVSAVANAASSTVGLNAFIGIGFGLITLACAATLTVHHYQHRRR
jgi:hypothetical protein